MWRRCSTAAPFRRAAGAANHESGGEGDRSGGPPLDPVDQSAYGGTAEVSGGLGYGGQRWGGVQEPGDVVERSQRDVLRYPQATLPDGVHRAERHQVVGG